MAHDRSKLTSVVWPEVFPWLNLTTALRLSISPRTLVLAALAWVAVVAGWRVCGATFSAIVNPAEGSEFALRIADASRWPWHEGPPLAGWLAQGGLIGGPGLLDWWSQSPLVEAHEQLTRPFFMMFNTQISAGEFFFWLCCALWELAVWGLFGGAICRLAAVALAREEALGWSDAVGFAQKKWVSYFSAPLFPLVGVAIAAVPLAVFGLLLRTDVGLVIAGALWFLVLLAGAYMAVLVIGLFFGFPLMWATISAEGTDAFDALSRAYAYTFQRPLLYVLYWIVAGVLGLLGWLVVTLFILVIDDLGNWSVGWLAGHRIDLDGVTGLRDMIVGPAAVLDADFSGPSADHLGLRLIRFWVDLAVTVATAFLFSYFWTATTAIYFLLRRHVDATEMDEVYVPEESEHGLPPLETDRHGVAGVPQQAGASAEPKAESAEPNAGSTGQS